ncbi:MAG: cysteine desulfurase / selenocysteine lyase [Actinomycetota bacterium]|jgi:cysteine desulfurase/selenocysteine lyase|nr:cysteine desulfurase / selenocysteine lyase [Actinomycetota bacterium]MDQ1503965.1 cysteine desulfurase / selenocysteine lyase [Actinomycetota bacterium]
MSTIHAPGPLARLQTDFPILGRRVNGKRLVYLDSAATSQKPQAVLDALDDYYTQHNANVHRGVYTLAEEATAAYEEARAKTVRFIRARSPREVIFTRSTTEATNLVAHAWGRSSLTAGDVVVLTHMEHHANIVPWHMLAAERGVELRWIPLTADGHLDLTDLPRLLDGAKLLGVTAVSNVLGTINDIAPLAEAAHAAGALVLVDAAQAAPHLTIDVGALGADFVAFSGHKMLGPTGIGVLWARRELLEAMPPFLGGGEMISDVRLDGFSCAELPWKFEAGTPPIAEAVGLGAAMDYLSDVGMDAVRAHELSLTRYALATLGERFGDKFVVHGPADPVERSGVLSFEFATRQGDSVHPHDIAQVLDSEGVCVRAGHHCAKPLMRVLGATATARASFYIYNDEDDVDALGDALSAVEKMFG